MKNTSNLTHYADALFFLWQDFKDQTSQNQFVYNTKLIYLTLKNNYEFVKIMASLLLPMAEKVKILETTFAFLKDENPANFYLYNFVHILLEHNAFGNILPILLAFFHDLDVALNYLSIKVYSRFLLNNQLLTQIKNHYSQRFQKQIILENYLDPNLIGGVKIVFEDQIHDFSIRGKMEAIKFAYHNQLPFEIPNISTFKPVPIHKKGFKPPS